MLATPCCNDPIRLLLSSLGAVRPTMMLPAQAQGMKSAAFGLRLGALLVCTGRWSGGMSPASARGDSADLLGRPAAGVGLGRPTAEGGLRTVPAQALGTKIAACGLRPGETCRACRPPASNSLSKYRLFRQEQVLSEPLV